MRMVLLCATRRGLLVLQKLKELAPAANLTVFSFREEAWEPPFLDAIRAETERGGGTFHETRKVGAEKWQSIWENTPVDLLLMVSWRYLVPPEILQRARRGAFVFHDSLLPEYRGFAPTVWAIANGEDHTGATLFWTSDAVDAGDIVDQERVPIGTEETIGVVIERVTETYLRLLERNLEAMLAGNAGRRPQDHSQATYTCRRLPEDNVINWRRNSREILNLIRAVTAPYPGAFTPCGGQKLVVWEARPVDQGCRYVGRVPGRVIEIRPGSGAVVLTGDGAILLTRVQLGGGPPACAAEILTRLSLTLGS